MFLNSPLFEKSVGYQREREEWNERDEVCITTNTNCCCTLPLCLAPGRPDCHLENEGRCLQRVKKKKKPLGDVADVTSKSLQRGLGSVKKLMQQDWHSTWDDCRSSHSHSPNRAEDIPTQTFCCQICRDCLQ